MYLAFRQCGPLLAISNDGDDGDVTWSPSTVSAPLLLEGPEEVEVVVFFVIKDRLVAVLSLVLFPPSAAVLERLVAAVLVAFLALAVPPLLLPSTAVFVLLVEAVSVEFWVFVVELL